MTPFTLLPFCLSSWGDHTTVCTCVFFLSISLSSPSLSLYLLYAQIFLSRETMTTVCARHHATWRATARRCPLSRYPAKHQPSTLLRNSTRQSSTYRKSDTYFLLWTFQNCFTFFLPEHIRAVTSDHRDNASRLRDDPGAKFYQHHLH